MTNHRLHYSQLVLIFLYPKCLYVGIFNWENNLYSIRKNHFFCYGIAMADGNGIFRNKLQWWPYVYSLLIMFGKIIWLKFALIEATNFISRRFGLTTFFKTVCFHTGQDKNSNTMKGWWKLRESFHPPFTLEINYIKWKEKIKGQKCDVKQMPIVLQNPLQLSSPLLQKWLHQTWSAAPLTWPPKWLTASGVPSLLSKDRVNLAW